MSEAGDRGNENALLFAAASDAAMPEPVAAGRPLDWDYLIAAADQQGITPLLHAWLERHPLPAPSRVTANLYSIYWTNHFRNQTLLRELSRVLRAAADAAIPVMPLKGGALATWYYPTADLRPMSDLDLLIRPADYDRMAELLRHLGYREGSLPPDMMDGAVPSSGQGERAFVTDADGMQVLVEYRVEALDPMLAALAKVDPTINAALTRHAERMWARAHPGTIAGAPCTRIAPEDLLLHVASHLVTRHAGFRLLWLRDLVQIATAADETFDWRYVADEARTLRLTVPVFAALHAAHRWLGAPIPLAVVADHFFGVVATRRSPLMALERSLFAARVRALGRMNLAMQPTLPWWLIALAILRLPQIRACVAAVRWIIAPSETYMEQWRGAPLEHGAHGYVAALLLRFGVIALRVCYAAGRRLGRRRLSTFLDRLIQRLQPAATYLPSGERANPSP